MDRNQISRKRKTTPTNLAKKALSKLCDAGTITHEQHIKIFDAIWF